MSKCYTCPYCGSNLDFGEKCDCQKMKTLHRNMTPKERVKAEVYASGNKWAIENFEATHN